MRFKDDILRGLRWGGVLIAVMGTGWLCYRIVTQPPPALEKSRRASSRSSAKSTKPNSAARRVPLASGTRDIPPPPPAGARTRRSLPAASAASGRSLEVAAKDKDDSVLADAASTEASVEPDTVPNAEKIAAENPVVQKFGAVAPPEEPAEKQEGRGKRMLKAAGRFLGFGTRKDAVPKN